VLARVPKTWRPDPSFNASGERGLSSSFIRNRWKIASASVVAVPDPGYKSRVAAELRWPWRNRDTTHLLLEGDLHRPWVQRMIGVDMRSLRDFPSN